MRIQLVAGFEMEERFNEIEYGGNLRWEDKKKPWLTARKKMETLVLQPNWTGFWPKNSACALKWICLRSLQKRLHRKLVENLATRRFQSSYKLSQETSQDHQTSDWQNSETINLRYFKWMFQFVTFFYGSNRKLKQ